MKGTKEALWLCSLCHIALITAHDAGIYWFSTCHLDSQEKMYPTKRIYHTISWRAVSDGISCSLRQFEKEMTYKSSIKPLKRLQLSYPFPCTSEHRND